MIRRIDLGGGVSFVIENRATGKVRLAFEHDHHIVTRADVERDKLLEITMHLDDVENAGAGGQVLASPQRDVCGREICGRLFPGGVCTIPAGERCGYTWCSNIRRNGGYVNWSLLAVLSLAAGVWVGLGASVAHWCRYF